MRLPPFLLTCTLLFASTGITPNHSHASVVNDVIDALPTTREKMHLQFSEVNDPDLDAIGEIKDIVQDNQGFIWLAGASGLARYDGYDAKLFLQSDGDIRSISTNSINDLFIDKDGYLWVATYWGLNRYDHKTGYFERILLDAKNTNSPSHNGVM